MNTDTIATLTRRRAAPLHRTFPTWARDVTGDKVEWRIYAPHRFGGAVTSRIILPVSTSRRAAASEIRRHRAAIWGRDKQPVDSRETALELSPPIVPACTSATPVFDTHGQGSLF